MASRSLHDDLLVDLNAQQREAVTHVDGPLLVLAGPGSGKTRVITRRAAHLTACGVAPSQIVCITFTNKAADEMRERIGRLGVARGMWIHTFHALAVRLLRENVDAVGLQPGFTILDDADQRSTVREALEAAGVNETLIRPEAVLQRISAFKNDLRTPAEAMEAAGDHVERIAARVYGDYQALLTQRNAVDFDDLLMKLARLLRDDAALCARMNDRFRYVLVDEYQDTNHAQYMIARMLSRHHTNLCVTGDPDQSIYAWRGANIGNILEFERDYPGARIVRLEENYRSTGSILRAADGLIRTNRRRREKALWTRNPEGAPVEVRALEDDRREAEFIADSILDLCAGGQTPGSVAVFYRINALSRGLEDALRIRAIPYRIARGVEFYARREIKDTLAYLRVLANPLDQTALERIINVPARGIGKTTLERLRVAAAEARRPLIDVVRRAGEVPGLKTAAPRLAKFAALIDFLRGRLDGPVSEIVNDVVRVSGMEQALRQEQDEGGEDRLANVLELINAATRYQEEAESPSLSDFLQRVALTSDQDAIDPASGAVTLMTLHTAKGLEFPNVFIAGCEQGLLPHEHALRDRRKGDVEEERRLCFVGITRAQRQLWLTWCEQRLVRGVVMPQMCSQFLRELPDDAVIWRTDVVGDRSLAKGLRRHDDEYAHESGFEDESAESAAGRSEGEFEPDPPQRPPRRPRAPLRRARRTEDEPVFTRDEPTLPPAYSPPPSAYDGWKPGAAVTHPRYGRGEVLWIRRLPGRTVASIRFRDQPDQVFVLEHSPVALVES